MTRIDRAAAAAADDDDGCVSRLTAAILAAAVAVYNVHVFWTMSLYKDGTSLTCDASDDNYFMMHVFEYLKLISYCVVPFIIVIVLNLCIIVRLRLASPAQYADSVSVASSTNTTASNRSRRYFFAKRSTTSAKRYVPQNVADESTCADLLTQQQAQPTSSSRREVMSRPA